MQSTITDLRQLIKASQEKAPQLASRLRSAGVIVSLYGIKPTADPAVFEVPSDNVDDKGNQKIYQVGKTCGCVDFQQARAPQDLCKHRLAIILTKRLEAQEAKREEEAAAKKAADEQIFQTALQVTRDAKVKRDAEAFHHLQALLALLK